MRAPTPLRRVTDSQARLMRTGDSPARPMCDSRARAILAVTVTAETHDEAVAMAASMTHANGPNQGATRVSCATRAMHALETHASATHGPPTRESVTHDLAMHAAQLMEIGSKPARSRDGVVALHRLAGGRATVVRAMSEVMDGPAHRLAVGGASVMPIEACRHRPREGVVEVEGVACPILRVL
mmetsp:Transcript_50495/g.131373  ORF Transcript_50495/g.131373 Transcript_50495/m.131373 type:complete len:184 (+) Transcript_50495:432-983(+)